MTYTLRLGTRGRVVLPAPVRARLDLGEGERLALVVEPDGTMRLMSLRRQVHALRGVYRVVAPAESLVDSLLGDRRREAAQ
ncbi:MAG TPA: AbrB/MazE/SpoVT family DNA-binding domain-containing protein [Chloroflexota bacterium]|nr:AbrB/MazE/SpoVT family DNA-binding domain-containing protein [Chloroflexota bacterium]